MKYSISIYAEGEREISLAEIVELADAVAMYSGIASGAGTMGYGAQLVFEAEDREWIGEYKSITTEMLTTDRDPNSNN